MASRAGADPKRANTADSTKHQHFRSGGVSGASGSITGRIPDGGTISAAPGLVDSAIQRVAECTARINSIRDQACVIADRKLGLASPTTGAADDIGEPAGSAHVLHYSITYLERAIEAIGAEVSRLHEL